MKVFKALLVVLAIVFFPIGIVYCIGKALFGDNRNFVTYLGILFIFLLGFVLCIYLLRPDLAQIGLDWIKGFFRTIE